MSDIPVRYYDNCPICGKELDNIDIFGNVLSFNCTNHCYEMTEGRNSKEFCRIVVFGVRVEFLRKDYSQKFKKKLEDKVRYQIDYWKENDRYLAKIMEGV